MTEMKLSVGSIMWASHLPMLVRAAGNLDFIDLSAYSGKTLEESPKEIDKALEVLAQSDVVLIYRSRGTFWETLADRLKELGDVPVLCIGSDPSFWVHSTVSPAIVAKVNAYMAINGEENLTRMLSYMAKTVCGLPVEIKEPVPVPWEGLYHPQAQGMFETIDEFLDWYKDYWAVKTNVEIHKGLAPPAVGLLFSRHAWVNDNLDVENALIRNLESQGLRVFPAFSNSVKDSEKGCKGSGEVVCDFFLSETGTPRIDAIIKMQFFPLAGTRQERAEGKGVAKEAVDILKNLDIPVFSPFTAYSKTVSEWREEPQGLAGNLMGFSIAMPEFEGVIEPCIIGARRNHDDEEGKKEAILERCESYAQRIAAWVRLRRTPRSERKVAFILHNNPCASVEATVGGGSQLDTLESVASIINQMQEAGYSVSPPANGKELIETIMDRKAVSEFRWTTVDEIVNKGGALKQVTAEEYREWFDTLSPQVKDRMNKAWGNPPGEEIDGVPPAMVYEGKILVTGVQYGNAVVCVQPKRGCAGPRCDGRVCKILHDPDIPPPHQYMATYRYLERDFGVHVIVHVGTHGNLEFLPGKSVGLSGACYPDLAIGRMPHLYIYNADNPAEGTIAKRRSYATLVNHMQTVMKQGGLYEGLESLDDLLGEYERVHDHDPGRTHTLQHMIMDALSETGLDQEITLPVAGENGKTRKIPLAEYDYASPHDLPFDEIRISAHGVLSRIRNTQIQDGLHIFGNIPQGDKRADYIHSILRYDAGEDVSLRKTVAAMMDLDYLTLLENQDAVDPLSKKNHGQLLEDIDGLCRSFVGNMMTNGNDPVRLVQRVMGDVPRSKIPVEDLEILKFRIRDIDRRMGESLEIDSLLHGFDGGFIAPGPSGLITRGRDDILPTGRNFYSLDPHRVPTRAAWEIGQKLAQTVIDKHREDEDRFPENVAIFWMAGDVMYADGEGMAQIMCLLGVEPVWQPNGRLSGFNIIPLSQLGRPRIDVTVRVSGITRDNFPNCIDIIDEAVQAVAALEEPEELNFVRKHTLANLSETRDEKDEPERFRNATFRVFASKPGTYSAGTQLAVYASAWKEEKDLSDIFIYWNGYAYGKDVFGAEHHKALVHSLKTVDVTYNKVVTDEKDMFGCCCYFGTHGGLTAAARTVSGHPVRTYYGDTREPEHVHVRDLSDEVRRVVRTKLLNPTWIEGMKRHGYKGAGDISKRVGRVYGWEATTGEVDDRIFDDITRTFVLNEENRTFFEENNPWALEEIGRRLLEAESRGLWNADPEVLEELKDRYLEVEGWIEERMGDVTGDFQGGSVDILTSEDVSNWGEMMDQVKRKIEEAGTA